MEKFAAGKRLSDCDESKELNVKRIKSESDDKNDEDPNEDNGRNNHLKDITREKEEMHFLELFTLILDTIINLKKLSEDDIYKHLSPMIESFKDKQTFHDTDFTKSENICAYLYRYASHGAGLARFRILNAIRNCEKLRNILKGPDLKIVSLGSGPGNDAVGFCSALSELQFPERLKLTLVDKFKEWCPWNGIARLFIREGNFGKVSEMFKRSHVELSFLQIDLPGNLKSDEKYFERLKEADVILMSKFLTSLNRENGGEHERIIIKSLYEHTKNDVVIIAIDTLGQKFWDKWKDFKLLYVFGDGETKDYKSTASAEKRFRKDDSIASKLPINIFIKENVNN